MIRTAVWLSATLLTLAGTSHAQQLCDRQSQSQDGVRVATLRQQLRAIKVDAEDLGTDVPQDAQRQLPPFKQALVQAVRDTVACHDAADPPADLQTEIAQLLQANPPQPPPHSSVANQDPRYAEWLSFAYASNLLVEAKKASSGLLSVQLSFHISCGNDTIWILFERQEQRWAEKLLWQAPPYKEVSGASGDIFLTTILPGDRPDGWRAVAIHGHPWCMSRFSSFDIDVLAPSGEPNRPRLIWHTSRGYSRGDYDSRLRSTANTFEFRTIVPAFDAMDYERTVVYRYSVSEDRVDRLGPIAVNGFGFVEEWLEAPWSEAASVSDETTFIQLKAIHNQFKRSKSWNSTSGPVLACRDSSKHFQVELDADDPHASYPRAFYQIQENGDGYTMLIANSSKPDPRCTGPNLMKKH